MNDNVFDSSRFALITGQRVDFKELEFPNGKKHVSLSEANDRGITFEQLADYIEEHWEML